MPARRFRSVVLAMAGFALLCALPRPARADEGMWTFDNFPSLKVAAKYGFAPSAAWLRHVRLSSLRIAGGCSASLISPHGLVMTNHHCVVGCLSTLSTPQQDVVIGGFAARNESDERKCPDFELDRLTAIQDVTPVVRRALGQRKGNAANVALRAITAKLQEGCGPRTTFRCDVVPLYHGGVYDVYRYRRYNDVRLVFAPEFSVAQFGGDPDNFNFPRYDFDIGLVRIYNGGKPLENKNYLKWSPGGSKAGDLVFVSGNPGGTSRELTVSQLRFERDRAVPREMAGIAEYRGLLEAFSSRGAVQAREAKQSLFFVENDYKLVFGHQAALLDPAFFPGVTRREQRLRKLVTKNPKLAAADASAWDDIARIQQVRERLFNRHVAMTGSTSERPGPILRFGLFADAVKLVQSAEERTKPNRDRLSAYTDQALVNVRARLAAPTPVHKDLEELTLTFYLDSMRRDLGPDDPFVRKILGNETPAQVAHRLISETHLDDAAVRIKLYDGGQSAISASTDPLIRFAATIDPDLRAEHKEYEAEVEAPTRADQARIAAARFAIYGKSIDPDATFTARLTYGTVKGFTDAQGRFVNPYTYISGLFERATGAAPYVLPSSWLDVKSTLNLSTPMNLCTTNDIIGGNSGSPLIDENGEVAGLIFDGNIFSLSGDYGYDGAQNRSIAVDSRALLEGLRIVYHMDWIVSEIETSSNLKE